MTRLCNNLPSCEQLLPNLVSNPLCLLMLYLPNSFRSLLISQRNLPSRLQSLVNLRILLGLKVSLSFTAVLGTHTAFSAIFRIFSCGLSSSVFTTASQPSDEPSHSSSNSSVQSKHVDDSHPLQPPQKAVLSSLPFSQSTQHGEFENFSTTLLQHCWSYLH